jgi:uncharacterized protein
MNIFLDTSSLFKLYHYETGSDDIEKIFRDNTIEHIFLSELSKIEFNSAIFKKVRKNEIDASIGYSIIKLFETDYGKYNFIEIKSDIIILSTTMIKKYGTLGLRSLDSIQLSSALYCKESVDIFITHDELLMKFFNSEELPIIKSLH